MKQKAYQPRGERRPPGKRSKPPRMSQLGRGSRQAIAELAASKTTDAYCACCTKAPTVSHADSNHLACRSAAVRGTLHAKGYRNSGRGGKSNRKVKTGPERMKSKVLRRLQRRHKVKTLRLALRPLEAVTTKVRIKQESGVAC